MTMKEVEEELYATYRREHPDETPEDSFRAGFWSGIAWAMDAMVNGGSK